MRESPMPKGFFYVDCEFFGFLTFGIDKKPKTRYNIISKQKKGGCNIGKSIKDSCIHTYLG